jgi:DNA polymerase I-like protein with 3'-5' exonuclease and polymerase domains
MIITQKKSDLVDELFKSGVGFEAMPLATVIEYAEADVRSCGEIFLDQTNDYAKEENASLVPIRDLSNEMLLTLVQMERNGIYIDQNALADVKQEFTKEKAELEKRLQQIVEEIMGDSPINLNSGADMTQVVYSRKVKDRNIHRTVFNIGVGANGKPLRPPRMKLGEFQKAVRTTTEVVKRTIAVCCATCRGSRTIQKYKVNGDPYKNRTKCPDCKGAGALYQPTGQTAGLKLSPKDASYASINGFKTDKETLKLLITEAHQKGSDIAVEFLTKISRLNAVSTYLDSFVQGIETYTRPSSFLHSNFNQCVTATGRLSSSNPNFQNQPKRGFPIRRCVVSRFKNGSITEADFVSLEWICAGELSRDQQIIDDIRSGKDVHTQTATIIHQCKPEEVTKELRASCKKFTFAPTYGGLLSTEAPHVQVYAREFFRIYKGLGGYHKTLTAGVLKNGIVQTPSGRQFHWANAKRFGNGRISNQTQIVNYPVQSFGNDIVQLSCIRTQRRLNELGLKSLLILSVHDSIVIDTAPDEVEAVNEVLTWAMTSVLEEAAQRWNYEFVLPLGIDIEVGKTWLM